MAGSATGSDIGTSIGVVTVWNDYICPWAYLARPHTEWLRSRGVVVDLRCYELHPDIAPEGRPTRPGGRLDGVFDHIADECAKAGLEFTKPKRTPNSHRCLELVELVRLHFPDALLALDDALARAQWVDGSAIDDVDVLDQILVTHLGRDNTALIFERKAEGEGSRILAAARAEALELGVTATPAWRLGELTITGLHAPEQFQRWASKVLGL